MLLQQTFEESCVMARNSNKEWTPEEEKRLLELAAAGKSRVMIAAALRRTSGSISGRLPLLRLRQAKEPCLSARPTRWKIVSMTDQQLLISTVREAGRIIAEHLEPREPPDAAQTLSR
jgi:hypothetical protein